MPYSKAELKVRRLEREFNTAKLCWESAKRECFKYSENVAWTQHKLIDAQTELEQERKVGE